MQPLSPLASRADDVEDQDGGVVYQMQDEQPCSSRVEKLAKQVYRMLDYKMWDQVLLFSTLRLCGWR